MVLAVVPVLRASSPILIEEHHTALDIPVDWKVYPLNMTTKTDSIHISIEGMTCASCVSRVESALSSVPGVIDARVNLAAEDATVEVADGIVPTERLVAAVSAAGYSAHPIDEGSDGDAEQEGRQRLYQ